MEAHSRTSRCTLFVGHARLDYAFTPTVGYGGTVTAYDAAGTPVYFVAADEIRDAALRINAQRPSPPPGIVRVETSFAACEYDGLLIAMWLLGHAPVKPHRSRTYRVAIAVCQGTGDQSTGWILWHRYTFSSELSVGLSMLLYDVYGVKSRIKIGHPS